MTAASSGGHGAVSGAPCTAQPSLGGGEATSGGSGRARSSQLCGGCSQMSQGGTRPRGKGDGLQEGGDV